MENKANTFEKGMNKDASPLKQPASTYRFALNSVAETREGNLSDLNSEEGNIICSTLIEGDVLKGYCVLDNNDKVLFIHNTINNTNSIYEETTECKLTLLITSSCFNWNDTNRIDCQYRLFKGCERVIYFTDGVNPVFRINLDSLIDYVPDSVTNDSNIPSVTEKIEFTNNNDLWVCNLLRLDRDEIYPIIEFDEIRDSEGSIEVGMYQFAIRYLDNDLNPSKWLYITNPIPVLYQNTNSNYYTIRGGVAGDGTGDTTGRDTELPPVNKSISLTINNLDNNYSFYQIAVLQSTATIGSVNEVYIKPEVPISSDIDQFIFTGKNSTQDIAGTISEILAERASIYTAKHLAQNNNRLLLSNVADKDYNWASFQKKASQIGSKYVTKQIDKNIYNESVKSGSYYYDNRSYMRDEVYAFAIVWVFKNGQESPAFHIPGRPINYDPVNGSNLINGTTNWDIATVTPSDNSYPLDHNFEFLPEEEQASHLKFKSYNTAVSFGDGTGLMGYYEVNAQYPDIRDCNGESIWGTDIRGGELAGRRIRHHRFPSANIEGYQDVDSIYPMGVEFFNIEPPSEYTEDIQGYYIVREIRSEVNKTIYDKGILDRTVRWPGPDINVYFRSGTSLDNSISGEFEDTRLCAYHSPKIFFNRELLRGSYVNIEGYFGSVLNTTLFDYESPNTEPNTSEIAAMFGWDSFDIYQTTYNIDPYFLHSRVIEDARYCDYIPGRIRDPNDNNPIGVTVGGLDFRNYLASTHLYLIKFERSLSDFVNNNDDTYPFVPNQYQLHYASVKSYKDVYDNLFLLTYVRTHPNIIDVNQSSSVIYGGDIFISKLDVTFQDFDRSRTLLSAYVESEINCELRHDGPDEIVGDIYKGPYFNSEIITNVYTDELSTTLDDYIWRHHVNDLPEYRESDLPPNDFVCEDPWEYNPDFSKSNTEKIYFPIPINYDYCSDCVNSYPYRIYYSERAFQEETVDNYLAILPNNYNDIMGDQGPITNMFIDKDRLFVHSNKALWNIQTRPNEITTSEDTLFIGAGDFLSIPPRKLISTDYGYGGSNEKWATVTTEAGTIFCDTNQGKVFMFTTGFEEISATGMTSFFENKLKNEFKKQFKELTGEDFPNVDALNDHSVGVIATYDPRYKRYIIHKKDYLLTSDYYSIFYGIKTDEQVISINASEVFYFEPNKRKFYLKSAAFKEPREIGFNTKEAFVNKSWTLSYNTFFKSWTSFHSYMPNMMYNDADRFYSFVKGSRFTWAHDKHRYNNYYNNKYPMIIEYVESDTPGIEKIFGSINYVSEVKKYVAEHDTYLELSNVTFDSFYCYTRDQISSTNNIVLKSLSPYSTIVDSKTTSYAARVDNSFRISKNIKDIAINRNTEPLLTSSWNITEYNNFFNIDGLGNGYIDVVPNPNGRDVNKSVYERANMKDKYLIIRLSFESEEDLRMSLQLSNNFVVQKIR